MIYTCMSPELSIASREKGIGPLFHCISVVGALEGSGKIRTHIFSIPKKEKKIKERERDHHHVPEIGG